MPFFTASCTAAASARTRASGFAAGVPVITRHPASLAHACHGPASDGSASAIAGVCAAATPHHSRLIMPQAAPDAFDKLLDLIRFF